VACEVKKSVGVGIDQLAGAVDVEENLRAADYEHDGQRGQQDDAQYSPRQAVAQYRQENFLFPSEGVSQVLVVIGKRSKKQIALWHCGGVAKTRMPASKRAFTWAEAGPDMPACFTAGAFSLRSSSRRSPS